jgi:hypothetical protein
MMAIGRHVKVEAERKKAVSVPCILRLAQKVSQEPRATRERGQPERQVTLRALRRKVGGGQA